MDTLLAIARAQANFGKPLKVFDWKKAAEIIRDRKPSVAEAGLEHDLEYTCGEIFRDGQIVEDSYTFLASNWATPLLIIDGEEIECYVMESETEWEAGTKWPDEARAILAA